jgi:hypothetical protein
MTYSKPELLATLPALDAIRANEKTDIAVVDSDQLVTFPAYEVDE